MALPIDRLDASVIATLGEALAYEQPGKDATTVSAVVRSGDLMGESGFLAEVFIQKSALGFTPAINDVITRGTTVFRVAKVLRDGDTAYRLQCQPVREIPS